MILMTFNVKLLYEMKTPVSRPYKQENNKATQEAETDSWLKQWFDWRRSHVLHYSLSLSTRTRVKQKHLHSKAITAVWVVINQRDISTKHEPRTERVDFWQDWGHYIGNINSTWIVNVEGRTTLCRFQTQKDKDTKDRKCERRAQIHTGLHCTKYQKQQQPPCNRTVWAFLFCSFQLMKGVPVNSTQQKHQQVENKHALNVGLFLGAHIRPHDPVEKY